MSTGDLLLVAATLIALLIAGAGLRSLRSGAVPSGYWAIGWAAMIVSGVLSLAARTQHAMPTFGCRHHIMKGLVLVADLTTFGDFL